MKELPSDKVKSTFHKFISIFFLKIRKKPIKRRRKLIRSDIIKSLKYFNNNSVENNLSLNGKYQQQKKSTKY